MRHLARLYQSFITKSAAPLFKNDLAFKAFFRGVSRKLSAFLLQTRNSIWFKDALLFFCLWSVPIGGIFINDYVTDHVEMGRIEKTLEKSLVSSAERYAETLYGLKNKILSEELYKNKESMHQLLAEVNTLQSYSAETTAQCMKGLRWVSDDLKAIGLYGDIRNFTPKVFLPFLRSLEQTPNIMQMININKTIYLGMGIAVGQDIVGYFLLPVPLKTLLDFQNVIKLKTFQLSSQIHIPVVGMTLDEFIKMPLSYVHIYKTANWRAYGFENGLAIGIFLAFACLFLSLKRKNDTKKQAKVLQLKEKAHCLSHNLLAQQKAANLIIHRLHEINGSMGEISNVLLETYSASTVFTEQEQMSFIQKICDFSSEVEKKIIKNELKESVDIKEVITECLRFYGHKIVEMHIDIRQAYDCVNASFVSDRDAFTQLILNLFHKALERTPEHGSILISMKLPEKESDGLFIVTIEDDGYSFSSDELKNYKQPNRPIFEDYFDLDWEDVINLARVPNCQVSSEKLLPVGNRTTLYIHEDKTIEDESIYEQYALENNIIRLFPAS